MKLLTLEQFCKEPNGTLFSEFINSGDEFESILQIKTGYYIYNNKPTFNGVEYLPPIFKRLEGEFLYDYDDLGEDNLSEIFSVDTSECDYDSKDRFIVYNKAEIKRMINMLQSCLD